MGLVSTWMGDRLGIPGAVCSFREREGERGRENERERERERERQRETERERMRGRENKTEERGKTNVRNRKARAIERNNTEGCVGGV